MKRILSLILTVLMLIPAMPAFAENTEALAPYDETLTVKFMASTDANTWFPEGEDFTDNVLLDYYLERLNIDFEATWSTDSSNYTSQIDLMSAADNLPDMFKATSEQVYRLVQAGQIQPIGELYEQYASDGVKEALGDTTAPYFSQSTVDGQVYGFPMTEDRSNYMPLVWIRTDWLEKVGMEAPDTWEEYEAVMKAFMDQCGAKYGIGFIASDKYCWDAFLAPSDAYYGSWVEKDGKIVYSAITDESKEALSLMNQWYKAGYLNPEFAVASGTTVRDDIAAGDVGMFIQRYYPAGIMSSLFTIDPSIEWVACPIPANADGAYAVEAMVTPGSYYVVNSKCENPEALIKILNLWHDLWRGESGTVYHGLNQTEYLKADESFKSYLPFWFDPPTKNMGHSQILWDIWPDGDITPYESDYELMKQWNGMQAFINGDTDNLSGFAHIYCYMQGFHTYANVYDAIDNAFINAFIGPLSEDYANYKAATDSTMQEYFIASIMGTKNLESDWDLFVESWNYSGGDFMTEYVNEWYANK